MREHRRPVRSSLQAALSWPDVLQGKSLVPGALQFFLLRYVSLSSRSNPGVCRARLPLPVILVVHHAAARSRPTQLSGYLRRNSCGVTNREHEVMLSDVRNVEILQDYGYSAKPNALCRSVSSESLPFLVLRYIVFARNVQREILPVGSWPWKLRLGVCFACAGTIFST